MSRKAFLVTLSLTLAAAVFFSAAPGVDLAASRLFYAHGFMGAGAGARAARGFFYALPATVCAAFILARLLGPGRLPAALVPSTRAVAFLVLSLAIGPGLLVNAGLKDHWHRPRPSQIEEFGGPWTFRPVWARDGECLKNCSFVSGEAAAAFWLVGPASLAPPPWKIPAVAAALAAGVATGLLRMAFGGHFLSDIVFSALFTLLLLQIMHALILAGLRGKASGL